ncbi:MAG TPA: VCBS repeat-containing protein, partial [Candidatus Thermoplasmatota archaeon]|nr:VCBS repeat-containing protein [Candidatus Thermoplasmatota archaeon]
YRQDGVTHVVQVNSAAVLTSWRFDAGASSSTSFKFVKEWERRQTDCFGGPGSDSKPVLADLDKDGRPEILVSTEESGIYAIRNTGSLYWKKCIGGGNGEPRTGDLNLDGFLDVVFGSDGGVVTAMNGRTGSTMWGFSVKNNYPLSSASIPVGAGIGQLDGLGGPDVVIGARDSHDPDNWENDHALLLALSSSGKVLWARQDTADGNPLTYTHPIIMDAAGDGKNEVYWADWNTIGHKPPFDESEAWRTTGPANFYRYDHLGNRVWKVSMSTYWNNKDLAMADADGDGQQEILATGPNGGHEGIWYLNTATGAKETFVDAYPWQVTRGPIVADLRGDGRMQFVLEVGPQATTAGAAIHVYEMGVPYSAKWPNVNAPLSGSGGGTGTTSPTSSSSSSSGTGTGFAVAFTGFRGNEWWVQASVGTNGPAIAKVDVRVAPDGAWKPLAKQSWGATAWAGSYHFAQGSVLQMRATASDGQADLSSCRQWIPPSGEDAAIVPCPDGSTSSTSSSSSSGTGGAFAAPFTAFRGNEWWVQAKVGTNGPAVSKVDVRIAPDGAWKPLAKQSWGTEPPSWAGSYHFAQGSVLQMRATASDGQADLSSCRQWIPPSGQDAAVVECPGTPTTSPPPTSSTSSSSSTGPSTFQASFAPEAVGNDWWVEVAVSANEPIAKVEASRNGGSFVALDLKDWGNWAKSIHTPDGTTVVFRATSSSGAMAVSSPVVWT